MKSKNKTIKAGIVLCLICTLFIAGQQAIATKPSVSNRQRLSVELGGPYKVAIGKSLEFDLVIEGGVEPYSWNYKVSESDSGRLVGAGGDLYHLTFMHNENEWLTVDLEVRDSKGNVASDKTEVFVFLSTDNSVFIEKFVKKAGTNGWQKTISAKPGDIIDLMTVIKTVGSDCVDLITSDELLYGDLSYIDGSANIEPTGVYTAPGALGVLWILRSFEPQSIKITYQVIVDDFQDTPILCISSASIHPKGSIHDPPDKDIGYFYASAYDFIQINKA